MTEPGTAGVWFTLADWCRLLAHDCTIPTCTCSCHTRRTTR